MYDAGDEVFVKLRDADAPEAFKRGAPGRVDKVLDPMAKYLIVFDPPVPRPGDDRPITSMECSPDMLVPR